MKRRGARKEDEKMEDSMKKRDVYRMDGENRMKRRGEREKGKEDKGKEEDGTVKECRIKRKGRKGSM